MTCKNCGKELPINAKFCSECNTPVSEPNIQTAAPANDAAENKTIFMLAYLGILFFLPLVMCPNSKTGRFHANQGLILLLTSIAGQIVLSILTTVLTWRFWTLTSLLSMLWGLAILALVIIGMMGAYKNEQKPLPVIGKFTIIK